MSPLQDGASVAQSLSRVDGCVSVREVNKTESEGQFAHKEVGLCETREKEGRGEEVCREANWAAL